LDPDSFEGGGGDHFAIMPVTEIVLPSLRQDEETRERFETDVKPLLEPIIGRAPGIKGLFLGRINSENNVNVESSIRYALGLGT
jgi:hypothetical protein